jgi:hypothetical protein
MHTGKKVSRTTGNGLFPNSAITTIGLALVMLVAFAVSIVNRQTAATQNHSPLPYSNALEMQYAQPWLTAQNKPVIAYSNALELQYAQPWLEAQKKPVVFYGNALELQYAQPWLTPSVIVDNSQEEIVRNCNSSLEMLYACKYGYRLP